MTDWHNTLAFLSVVIAVVVLSFQGHANDAAAVGLIGVLGTFRPRSPASSNVEQADTVNVGDKSGDKP